MKDIFNKKLFLLSLGCAKNRVDSEKTLAMLAKQGCEVVNNPSAAELILINSCGFIGDARQESIDAILEMQQYKDVNPDVEVVVMGCMVQLYKEDMAEALPEVDRLIKLTDKSMSEVYEVDNPERMLETGVVSAYLKISEGCSNSCSFCAIPLIRGGLKSRPVNAILEEAKLLKNAGVKEICLVSQDSSRYGLDLKMKDGLPMLLQRLIEDVSPEWIRLHYLYPTLITDKLLQLMAEQPSVCNYLDVPFQHIHTAVLARMGRQESEQDILSLMRRFRSFMPRGAVRSSFIVGFPGETEQEFNKLADFVRDAKIDHVGVFTYSPEQGTKAALLPDDVPEQLKQQRREKLMEIQAEVSSKINSDKVGRRELALVERFSEEENLLLGRLQSQAADVDGEVILDSCEAALGDIVEVEIVEAMEYDLIGRPV